MKLIVLSVLAGIMAAGIVFAEEPAKVIVLPAKPGDVKFEHQKHIQMKNSCAPCHTSEKGGKIEGFGKDMAHTVCKGCHTDQKAGPTVCSGCHRK